QIDLIATTPSVEYHVLLENGDLLNVDNPSQMPPQQSIATIEEPDVFAHVLTPADYLGNIMKLCQDRRGIFVSLDYIEEKRAPVRYRRRAAEIRRASYERPRVG